PTPCRRAFSLRRAPRRRSSPGSRAASARRIRAGSACPGTRGSSRRLAPVPLRIPELHGLAARLEGMALIELERLRAVVGLFLHFARERLDRRGRQARSEERRVGKE